MGHFGEISHFTSYTFSTFCLNICKYCIHDWVYIVPGKCILFSLPSALSVWVCTRTFRYTGTATGTQYRTVRGSRRQWRLWICLRLRASGRAATATCGPSRLAAPRMKIQPLQTQTHHHPPLQATAIAPTQVSTSEEKVGQGCWR